MKIEPVLTMCVGSTSIQHVVDLEFGIIHLTSSSLIGWKGSSLTCTIRPAWRQARKKIDHSSRSAWRQARKKIDHTIPPAWGQARGYRVWISAH
jgi:hypothetical protein